MPYYGLGDHIDDVLMSMSTSSVLEHEWRVSLPKIHKITVATVTMINFKILALQVIKKKNCQVFNYVYTGVYCHISHSQQLFDLKTNKQTNKQ